MKNKQKVLIGVFFAVVIIGIAYFYSKQNVNNIYRNETVSDTYKILQSDGEGGWRSKLIQTNNPEKWNVPSKNIEIKVVGQQFNFYCGAQKANFIKYFSFDARSSSTTGGWNSLSVVDCGEYYFIYEYGDAGPKLFGSFEAGE